MKIEAYGFTRLNDGLFPFATHRRVAAQRAAIWYSGAVTGVHYSDLKPIGSDDPLNKKERTSWRDLYQRGTRCVRVTLEVQG